MLGSVLIPCLEGDIESAIPELLALWSSEKYSPGKSKSKPVLIFFFNSINDENRAQLEEKLKQYPDALCHFKKALVLDAKLAGEADLYIRTTPEVMPSFGLKSGPNLMFERAMHAASRFNGWCLQIEVDAIPVTNNWLSKANTLTSNTDWAWVIGSSFGGERPLDNAVRFHLNGNALYNAGNADFVDFVSRIWLPRILSNLHQSPDLAYDCWWSTEMHRSNSMLRNASWQLWKFYSHKFVSFPFIINLDLGLEHASEFRDLSDTMKSLGIECLFVHGRAMNKLRKLMTEKPEVSPFDLLDEQSIDRKRNQKYQEIKFRAKKAVVIDSPGIIVERNELSAVANLQHRNLFIPFIPSFRIYIQCSPNDFELQYSAPYAPDFDVQSDCAYELELENSYDESTKQGRIIFRNLATVSVQVVEVRFDSALTSFLNLWLEPSYSIRPSLKQKNDSNKSLIVARHRTDQQLLTTADTIKLELSKMTEKFDDSSITAIVITPSRFMPSPVMKIKLAENTVFEGQILTPICIYMAKKIENLVPDLEAVLLEAPSAEQLSGKIYLPEIELFSLNGAVLQDDQEILIFSANDNCLITEHCPFESINRATEDSVVQDTILDIEMNKYVAAEVFSVELPVEWDQTNFDFVSCSTGTTKLCFASALAEHSIVEVWLFLSIKSEDEGKVEIRMKDPNGSASSAYVGPEPELVRSLASADHRGRLTIELEWADESNLCLFGLELKQV